jgi:hypothetical protein
VTLSFPEETMSKTRTLLFVLLPIVMVAVGCGGGSDSSGTSAPASTPTESAAEPTSSQAAPAVGGSASLSGTIVYEGKVPNLPKLRMDADPGCAKKHSGPVESEALVLGEGNTLANVFVWVKGGVPSGDWPVPAEPVVLDQNGCQYKPHVSGLMVGQSLKVLNSDELLHNIHSLPKINSSFNRAMPATVTEAEYSFSKEEVLFKIKCDVHPWMNAWIGVVSHPFFAVTDANGKFAIEGLPAGTYEIEARHEKMDPRSESLTLADGEAGALDFSFSR